MIQIKQVSQRTSSSCGPTVVQMLLGYMGKKITQKQFIEAAEIQDWIKKHGTQPKHMVKAVKELAPDCKMWFKNKSSVKDLIFLVKKKKWPVAVNWQGLFWTDPKDEKNYPNPENGHYCIVVDINKAQNAITLVDPYPGFAKEPRIFPLDWFVERWWDIGEEVKPRSNKTKKILTNKLMFVIAPKKEKFPEEIEMVSKFSSN